MRLFATLRNRLHQDQRLTRMLHGGASSLLARGVAMLVSLVTLPLTIRYLGKVQYGVWVTVSTTVVMLSVLDLGIANTLTNFISEAFAEDDREKAQGYFSSAFWMTVAVAATLGAIAAAVWPFVDWGKLLHLTSPALAREASECVGISVAFFLLSLPLNLANRVLSGYQQVHVTNYFQMLNSVLGLVAVIAVVLLRGGLVSLMLMYCGAMLTGSLTLNFWLMLRQKPWIRPHPRKTRRHMVRALLGQGALFFVLQITTLVVFNSDNLVISHYLGPAEVTPYSVAWRLIGYATLFQFMLVPSFWPAFTEAYRKGELDWVRRNYHRMERTTLLAVSSAALLIGLFGRPVIGLWAGRAAVPPALLLWTMAAWAVVSCITTNQALLLTATARLKVETIAAVLAAVANLGASIVLVQRIGAEGVILSTLLSFCIFMVVPQGLEVRRILRGAFLTMTTSPAQALDSEAK